MHFCLIIFQISLRGTNSCVIAFFKLRLNLHFDKKDTSKVNKSDKNLFLINKINDLGESNSPIINC